MKNVIKNISWASAQTGLSEKTIRLLEKHGVVVPSTTLGNQRRYSPDELALYDSVVRMQKMFPPTKLTAYTLKMMVALYESNEISHFVKMLAAQRTNPKTKLRSWDALVKAATTSTQVLFLQAEAEYNPVFKALKRFGKRQNLTVTVKKTGLMLEVDAK